MYGVSYNLDPIKTKTANILAGGRPILFEWVPVLFFMTWVSQIHKSNFFYAGGLMPPSHICVTSPASRTSKTVSPSIYLLSLISSESPGHSPDLQGIIFFSHPPAPETIWRTSSGRTILVLPYQHSLTGSDQSHFTWWVCARQLSRNSFSS